LLLSTTTPLKRGFYIKNCNFKNIMEKGEKGNEKGIIFLQLHIYINEKTIQLDLSYDSFYQMFVCSNIYGER
jgi:hypothetical protein